MFVFVFLFVFAHVFVFEKFYGKLLTKLGNPPCVELEGVETWEQEVGSGGHK